MAKKIINEGFCKYRYIEYRSTSQLDSKKDRVFYGRCKITSSKKCIYGTNKLSDAEHTHKNCPIAKLIENQKNCKKKTSD